MKKVFLMMTGVALSAGVWAQSNQTERDVEDEMEQAQEEIEDALEEAFDEIEDVLEDIDVENLVNIRMGNRQFTLDQEGNWNWDDDDDDYRKRRRFRTEDSWNLEVGLNNVLTDIVAFPIDQPYNLSTWESHYIALARNYSTKLAGPLYMEYGASVSWYNFVFDDADVRAMRGADEIEFSYDTSDIVHIRSKIQAPYVNVHFVPVLDLSKGTLDRSYQGKGFRIGAGGYAGYRIGGRTKVVFEDNGDRQRLRDTDNLFLENFRYGVRGQIGFRGVDLFLNYDLNEVFASGRGPELNAFSFGLVF
ncbi:MAG TPA: hypothetical protein DCE41_24100 [Cytophagales bacterium]|nr:hypothetical protein [Cytophagales bacterium]HAA18809.1 hypothetical protein [Cytophagales bacterium]HAP64361.1 hypothetical protein [Cytophagales bacterium]